jgi:hypothetical protein
MEGSTALAAKSTPRDLYYQDEANSLVQSIPVVYDTRFRNDFATLGAGQVSLFIPPSNGINKVIIVLEYTPTQLAGVGGTAAGSYVLPRGWGYNALSLLSWRIAGSQQYFASGAQLLAANLRKCRTQSQRDALLSLGGNEVKLAADFTVTQRAYIPLSFFTTPSNDGLDCPVASDILGSQIQITTQVAPASVFWVANPTYVAVPPASTAGVIPTAFNSAYFQVEQLSMEDRSMSLASRPGVNMDTSTYIQSLRSFDQQELTAPIAADATGLTVQTVTLNGFMSGQVRGLQVWLTKNNDLLNANVWYIPDSVRCIFAGQVYAQYETGSSSIWNLIDGTAPGSVNGSLLASVANVVNSTPVLSEYAILPFAQPAHNDYEADIMVSGLRITNGSIQLQVIRPASTVLKPVGGADTFTLHCVPILNAALAYSRGSATLLIG